MFEVPGQYKHLIGKVIYLTVTHPDVTFTISLISQFMHEPRMVYWHGALRMLAYIKGALGKSLVYRKNNHLWIMDMQGIEET